MANITALQLTVILFVGLVYAQFEDFKCAGTVTGTRCSNNTVQCALCDGELRFFRSECAVNAYNCNINDLSSLCRIVKLEDCIVRACPVPCKVICATDGVKYYAFKSECDYFNHICKSEKPLKEVDVKYCFAIKDTIE